MTTPTAVEIREWSDVDFDDIGNGKLAEDTALDRLIARAAAWVVWATGRPLDTMPPEFEPLAQQAIQYATEDMAYGDSNDAVSIQEDWQTLASFSASSYSETRRDIGSLGLRKLGMIAADPRLNSVLWALLTDDMRDKWEEWMGGGNTPDFEVTDVDWGVTLQYDPEPRGRSWPVPEEW